MPVRLVPLTSYVEYPPEEMARRARAFYADMNRRRTIREFSDRPVPREIIEDCLRTAGTAPSGANLQPWQFVVVEDPDKKREIRLAAEQEEREFYNGKAPQDWLDALEPLGTDERKPFLEIAPCLIVAFEKTHTLLPDGRRIKNYYVSQSTGLASGLLIAAVHNAGLVSLTHTPSPMKFLNGILDRNSDERPFLILVAGYPADGAQVPDIQRKHLSDIAVFV